MANKTHSIGIIIASTRQPRVGPQITNFVVTTIQEQTTSNSSIKLNIIDLADWPLPFFDEPGIPKKITDHNDYTHEHTRRWSIEIQRHSAFIFVTPQYNFGYPAALKNSIDFLFNEWAGKPAMIVSYGGHGGGKCNAQLREVLNGIDMIVTKQSVKLAFPSKDALVSAATEGKLKIDARSPSNPWRQEQKAITTAYSQLIDLVGSSRIKVFLGQGISKLRVLRLGRAAER